MFSSYVTPPHRVRRHSVGHKKRRLPSSHHRHHHHQSSPSSSPASISQSSSSNMATKPMLCAGCLHTFNTRSKYTHSRANETMSRLSRQNGGSTNMTRKKPSSFISRAKAVCKHYMAAENTEPPFELGVKREILSEGN